MEINSPDNLNPKVQQITDLLLRFLRQRPGILLPEHVLHFHEQIEQIKSRKPDDINIYQFATRIFIHLAHRETPPTMGELSEDLKVPYSTATRIVDLLVKGSFVERIPDPDDRRIVRVRMDENGKQFYETSLSFMQQRMNGILQAFTSEEQDDLFRLFSKLLDTLEHERLA